MTILSDRTIKALCTGDCRDHRQGAKPYIYRASDAFKRMEMSDKDMEIMRKEFEESFPSVQLENMQVALGVDYDYEIDNDGQPMISPFSGHQVRYNTQNKKIISYGLSSYGYDVRLCDREIKVFTNANGGVVDPMAMDSDNCLVDAIVHDPDNHPYFILPPNSYALGCTVEQFKIPRNVNVICVGKSTFARAGVGVNVTPIEAGFEGTVVIEIANQSALPVKIYLGVGIAQFMFLHGDQPCDVSYADGNRKYQGQQGVTLSRV